MESLPDPTRNEARALIIGLGSFWGLGAVDSSLLDSGRRIGLVPFTLALIAGFGFFGGVAGIGKRAEREAERRGRRVLVLAVLLALALFGLRT